jgi:hypothetical protein
MNMDGWAEETAQAGVLRARISLSIRGLGKWYGITEVCPNPIGESIGKKGVRKHLLSFIQKI